MMNIYGSWLLIHVALYGSLLTFIKIIIWNEGEHGNLLLLGPEHCTVRSPIVIVKIIILLLPDNESRF